MKLVAKACLSAQGTIVVTIAFVLGALVCYTLQQQAVLLGASAAPVALHLLPGGGDRFHQVPCPAPHPPNATRRNLVFAAVGDSWTPDRWSYSGEAGWDLAAVYFGNRSDWSCPQCTLALRMPQAMKWQMVWALMKEAQPQWSGIWANLSQRYDYLMVADDDLIMDACTIDILFQSMRRHNLLAAQPSNCRGNDSDNPYWVHWQLPGLELHYVNVVEVTAPAFQMRYFDKRVRPLLENSFSGWGLPYCFSALARFPRARLAAVDGACMIHPSREDVGRRMSVSTRIRQGLVKEGSIYSRFGQVTPYSSPLVEQRAVWQVCGFTKEAAHALRQAYPPFPVIHGTVLAEGSSVAPPPLAAGGGAAALAEAAAAAAAQRAGDQQQQEQEQQQQLLELASSAGLLRGPMLLVVQLGLAAVAGAVAALRWDKHRAKGAPPAPHTLPPMPTWQR